MLYVERAPAEPLSRFIQTLWYVQAGDVAGRRERTLPTGCVQVIVSLARDFLLDCGDVMCDRHMPPALVVGARSRYEIIDCSDMADLIGVSFTPGGFAAFTSDSVSLFSNIHVALVDVWGGSAESLRCRLLELRLPEARLDYLERFLLSRLGVLPAKNVIVEAALSRIGNAQRIETVRDMARSSAFAGIDATNYCARRTRWANHIGVD